MNLSNSMFDVSVIYRFSGESSTIVTDLDRYDASTLLFSGDLRQLPQLAPIGVALKEKIFLSVIFLSVSFLKPQEPVFDSRFLWRIN